MQFGKNGPEATVLIEKKDEQTHSNLPNQFQRAQANNPQFQFPQNQTAAQNQPVNWKQSVKSFGVQNPDSKAAQNQTGRYVGMAIAIFAIVFLGLLVTLMIVGNLGIIAAVIAAVVAFVPAAFYILPLMFLDRYDPEPPWALALAFAWGALVAVLFSAVVNDFVGYAFGESVGTVVSAPIFEEASKGLGVVLFLIFLRREFDDILDGIVYAGTIALGFATVENVLYYGRGLLDGGSETLIFLFVLRGILSPFAHVTFTAMTGIGCGISRESHNPIVRVVMPIIGYFCAVLLHAIWNGVAVFFGSDLLTFLKIYIILDIPFFLLFVGFVSYVMYRQNKILKQSLAMDVARGLISQEHVEIATSAFKSTTWLLSSVFTERYKARKGFLRAVGKLGLSYWHIQRAAAAKGYTVSLQQNPLLREEVLKWRDKI
jgi:RsiW-degrading membrane proteinase PrsW (M82 family)